MNDIRSHHVLRLLPRSCQQALQCLGRLFLTQCIGRDNIIYLKNALNIFNTFYCVRHMEKVNNKMSFIFATPQTVYHILRYLLHQSCCTGYNEKYINESKDRSDDPSQHKRTLLPRTNCIGLTSSHVEHASPHIRERDTLLIDINSLHTIDVGITGVGFRRCFQTNPVSH